MTNLRVIDIEVIIFGTMLFFFWAELYFWPNFGTICLLIQIFQDTLQYSSKGKILAKHRIDES